MSEIRVDTISEKTSANGVAVDGVTLKDGGFTATLGSTITTADNTTQLTLKSTDADASVGPDFVLQRDSGSPADDDSLGRIRFVADNDAGEALDHISINATIRDASDGTEDAQLTFNMLTAGAVVDAFHISPTETVFNDASADRNFRIESNGNATMLVVDGENNRVGIGSNPDLGAGLHIKTADSGASAHANADELVIESSGNGGMTLLNGTSSTGVIHFGDSGNNAIGFIAYSHALNHMTFSADNEDPCLTVHNAQIVSMGVTENAPDVAAGLCISQGGSDGNIMTFKNSDFSGGADEGEADTFASFKKQGANDGGLAILGVTEAANLALVMRASCDSASVTTTTSTSGYGVFATNSVKRDGSGNLGHLAANDNMCTFLNNDTTEVIFKGDGEIHSNQTATVDVFDTYDDAQLVRAYDLSKGKYEAGLINSKFDKFVQYNAKDLVDANLIGQDEDGTPNSFVNITGFQRLHNGAIWQQYEKHQRLASAFYKLATKTIGKEEADKLLTEEEIQLLN